MKAAVRITEEVFQVGGSALTDPEDAAVYLVRFEDEAALIDAGCGRTTERLLRNVEKIGVDLGTIRTLFVTHCHFDHAGGIRAIRERTGCRVVAHELDARFLEEGNSVVTAAKWYGSVMPPTPVDVQLRGQKSEVLLADRLVNAIHTPGHSPGSMVYLVESGGLQVLFGQDIHGPLHDSLLSNRDDYRRSLQLLLSLEADVLCEGHYGIFQGKEEVRVFIETFL